MGNAASSFVWTMSRVPVAKTGYLAPLRAPAAGANVLERQPALREPQFSYFLAQMPKWAADDTSTAREGKTIGTEKQKSSYDHS